MSKTVAKSLSVGSETMMPVGRGRQIIHELCRVALIALPILLSFSGHAGSRGNACRSIARRDGDQRPDRFRLDYDAQDGQSRLPGG
jgi:hypothetical protein